MLATAVTIARAQVAALHLVLSGRTGLLDATPGVAEAQIEALTELLLPGLWVFGCCATLYGAGLASILRHGFQMPKEDRHNPFTKGRHGCFAGARWTAFPYAKKPNQENQQVAGEERRDGRRVFLALGL